MDCHTDAAALNGFITVLMQESAAIERLLSTIQQLQQCLIHFDTDGIERLTKQQEFQLEQLEQLEHQRWLFLSKLLDLPFEKARTLTMSEVMPVLPSNAVETLTTLQNHLRDQLEQMQLANAINRMLALRGRNSIAATLAFVHERNLHALNTAL